MVLTDRDRRLVAAVQDFGILTREQLQRLLAFGSVTRINAVLLRLTRHQYLTHRLQPSVRGTRRVTYAVGPAGAELLGDARPAGARRWRAASDLFVEHQLLINDVRLAFMHASLPAYRFDRWTSEEALRLLNLGLVPDGYAEYSWMDRSFAFFLEADRGTESRTRWEAKVDGYLSLTSSERFPQAFHRTFFRVLVVLPSDRRLENVRREIARRTDKIFWLCTRDRLLTDGPLAPIWVRPSGETYQSLTPPP